jgi:F420-non-reducing hydrogenase iron-sulfur subunit
VQISRTILESLGLNPERLALHWASAAEGLLFVHLITNFTKKVAQLGPLGAISGFSPQDLKRKLAAARAAVTDVKLRIRFAQLARDLRQERDYSWEVLTAKMAEKVGPAIRQTLAQNEALAQGH